MKNKLKKIIAADIALYLAGMGTFLMFHYIVPYSLDSGTVITAEGSSEQFALPSDNGENGSPMDAGAVFAGNGSGEKKISPEDKPEPPSNRDIGDDESGESKRKRPSRSSEDVHDQEHFSPGKFGGGGFADNESTEEIRSDGNTSLSQDITSETLASERTDTADITVKKCSFGEGEDKVTYYLADIYVTSADAVKTAFAGGTYGKNIRSGVDEMASENGALIAVSGDYYGNSEDGVVIRNGVLYRNNPSNADICVLFSDGTMKTYSPSEFDADEVIAAGAWQAWTFGPALLDENVNVAETFNSNSYINGNNPRCAIGMVSPGHYVFVVADGREKGYSRGVTLTELASIMSDAGCKCAYNLDGGRSSAMYFGDSYISSPADGGREISDIIYIG